MHIGPRQAQSKEGGRDVQPGRIHETAAHRRGIRGGGDASVPTALQVRARQEPQPVCKREGDCMEYPRSQPV